MKLVLALLSMCIIMQGTQPLFAAVAGKLPSHANNLKIVQISIPKCGTHLLSKCLQLLGKEQSSNKFPSYTIRMQDFAKTMSLPDGGFWMGHLIYKTEYAQLISRESYAPIFIYRDPRDHVVSFAYYLKKIAKPNTKASIMTIDELITDQIATGSTYPRGIRAVFINVDNAYKVYLPWMSLPNMLCIRFEDLIGAHGGGSDEAQIITIKKIAQHIGINVTNQKLLRVKQNLFGNSDTFREGKIGAWKSHFTPEQKEMFKNLAGQLLIDLGYESDLNW